MIDRIFRRYGRVSYKRFSSEWYVGRPAAGGTPPPPSQPTFCRVLEFFRRRNRISIPRGTRLVEWISSQFAARTLDPDLPRDELAIRAAGLMAAGNMLAPSRGRFQRALGAALRILREEESQARFSRLQKSLGVSLEALPVVHRWAAAKELLRYPPAYIGKANIPKMAEEHKAFRELSKTLATNGLDPRTLLDHPDCERLFQFVERRRPSLLGKWADWNLSWCSIPRMVR